MKGSEHLVGVLCTALAFAQSDKPAQLQYKGPLCSADFCLEGTSHLSEKDLVVQYGSGLRIGEFRCYALPEHRAFVHFGVEHDSAGQIVTVVISDAPNCKSQTSPPAQKSPFPVLKTKEGILLGDSEEKVLKVYGPPSSTRDGDDATFKMVPANRARRVAPLAETAFLYDGPGDELIQGVFLHPERSGRRHLRFMLRMKSEDVPGGHPSGGRIRGSVCFLQYAVPCPFLRT